MQIMRSVFLFCIFSLMLVSLFHNSTQLAIAETAEELKSNITSHAERIKKLDEEIKQYNTAIAETVKDKESLQATVKTLDLTAKKLGTEIQKTETGIKKSESTISELSRIIGNLNREIDINKLAMGESIASVHEADQFSLIERLFSGDNVSDVLKASEEVAQLGERIREKTFEIKAAQAQLANSKTKTEKEKQSLSLSKRELVDQSDILSITKKESQTLLTLTKNKESEYKKLLVKTHAEKERFEKELFEYESKLKFVLDPSQYAIAGNNVFSWPLDNVYVTQRFGRTAGASRLYVSGSHNGIDFRASMGTRVRSIGSGTVTGTGSTDQIPGCFSYGKWILVTHDNGLSSVYAHLSRVGVSAGERVSRGDTIGYSGNTGYSTGPHLHLGLFVSSGVKVQLYDTSRGCKNATIPIANPTAYLDPLQYLPAY